MATSGFSLRSIGAFGIWASMALAANAQGALDVDEDAAERALERTLALEGAVLLPPGTFEGVFALNYDYTETDLLGGDLRSRRDRVVTEFQLRYGLPFDAQLEMALPFNRVTSRFDTPSGSISTKDTGSGIGDFRIGISKTLLRESQAGADLVGRLTWSTATGDSEDNGVALTSDTEEVRASLSAVKRLDPVALSGRIGYEWSLENDDGIDFGDSFTFGVSASLAASPTVSLSAGLNAAYSGKATINGVEIPGTDTNQATVSFGVSSVVGRNLLANATIGAGLTDDTADYSVGFSLSKRFGRR